MSQFDPTTPTFENRAFPRVVAVEGPIGAGKSTLLDALERRYAAAGRDDVLVVREPVAEWEAVADARGENIIQRFYRDPGAHAFAFQTLICATQVAAMRRAARENPRCRVLVCERSLSASRHVFAAMMRDEGLFRPLEHEIYCRAFDALAEGALPAQIVYLACPPAVCAARIAGRARGRREHLAELSGALRSLLPRMAGERESAAAGAGRGGRAGERGGAGGAHRGLRGRLRRGRAKLIPVIGVAGRACAARGARRPDCAFFSPH